MKTAYRLAAAANRLLLTAAGLLAALLAVYGIYVLYDIFYTNENAFVSYDLLQYRPVLNVTDAPQEKESFAALRQINPDTVGWIELFGTNINYPVVQGRDDLEYLNKDIYGNTAMTGSIYLAAENSSDFNDWYNLIYGHHMENGAMFGDIDKFLDQDYFDTHRQGVLQTPDAVYDISVFACVSTDSYEGTVYRLDPDAEHAYPALRTYIAEHAAQQTDLPDMPDENMRLLGLSTCSDAVTNGRIVLFAGAVRRDPAAAPPEQAADGSAAEQVTPAHETPRMLKAVGHLSDSSHWALLNLICLLLTFLTLLPLFALRRKYRQLPYAQKHERALTESGKHDLHTNAVLHSLRTFIRRFRIGTLSEVFLLTLSAIVFLQTENMTKPMVLRDGTTGLMILIEAAALLIDYLCFRYRGEKPDDAMQSTDPEGAAG